VGRAIWEQFYCIEETATFMLLPSWNKNMTTNPYASDRSKLTREALPRLLVVRTCHKTMMPVSHDCLFTVDDNAAWMPHPADIEQPCLTQLPYLVLLTIGPRASLPWPINKKFLVS